MAGLLGIGMGCELITAVDRGKIDNTGGSTGGGGTGGTTGGGGAACTPEDDNNECTDDICDANNQPAHTNKAAGTACTMGGSMCDGNGACVECLAPSDCPGEDNACQTRTCDQGTCGFDYAAKDTPIPTQTAGDCKLAVCDGMGVVVDNNDDTDLPDDSNDCTDDLCTDGTPSHTDTAKDTACGVNGDLFCDGAGACIGCNDAAQCGTNDECTTYTCVNNTCGTDFTPKDTPVASQTDNDCLLQACDGNGNIAPIADDTDLPLDDGNACTDEACNAGVPDHPNKANGAVCDDSNGCTQTDTCQSGTCTGSNPLVCTALDQCHDVGTCDPGTGLCSNPNKADGTSCSDGSACTQTDTCQAGACTGANPVTCTAQDQCHDVGTCNPATGVCSNPNKTDGTSCSDGDACTQTDTCQAGACTGANPVTCTAQDTCHDVGTCNPATGVCSNPTKADGASCSDGNGCTQTDTCQAGACVGANPVTCTALDQCHDVGTCDTGTGVCSNPNKANGTSCTSGGKSGTCQAGACAACGDGTVVAPEGCDDGNNAGNDGCSAKCAVEAPYTCTGAPSNCTSAKEINCNDNKDNDGDGQIDCADSDCALACDVNVGACSAGQIALVYTATDTPKTIPDNSAVGGTSNITVGGLGSIKRVVMQTNITHTYDADIDATLTSPGNVATDVTSDNGSFGDNYTDTIFNTACPTSVTAGAAPFTGCFKPEASFGVYVAGQAKGTWAWKAADDTSGDTGTINSWRLALCVTNTNCGDGATDAGETCDDGNAVNGDGCDTNCTASGCGNGILSGAEVCDDGNAANGDGCTSTCTVEAGYTCSGVPSVCAVVCGDGVLGPGETCDDGNTTNGDCCSSTCQVEAGCETEPNNTCGTAEAIALSGNPATGSINATIKPLNDQDMFSFTLATRSSVRIETFIGGTNQCTAGTGSTDTEFQLLAPDCSTVLGSDDDDGPGTCSLIDPTVAADSFARALAPNTYFVKVFEHLNDSTVNLYQLKLSVISTCGNGVIEPSEACDDNNSTAGDGCSATCQVEAGFTCSGTPSTCITIACGNGVIQGAEACDDNNTANGDGCSSTCAVESGYACTGQPSVCTPTCGDGAINGTDQCDDSNTANGDGCSSTCKVEPGYTCTGAPSTCTLTCGNGTLTGNEQCDDNNTANGDGCSATCQVEPYYQCDTGTLPTPCTMQETDCNDGNDNDGDTLVDAADWDCTLPAYFAACGAGESLLVYRGVGLPKAIPDNNATGITTQLFATLPGTTVTKTALLYTIPHTWDGDVNLFLTPPSATALDVCSGNGSSGVDFTNTILDTTCATNVTAGSAPFSGCYKPETAFTSLNGTDPTGVWQLKVSDTGNGDTGTLNSWALVLCTTP